jgi:hypothetical protein
VTKSEPLIPLKHAEMLFVAMGTLVHVLESRTDYPVDNMENVLTAYKRGRDGYLKGAGLTDVDIKLYTAAATEALIEWLDSQAEQKELRDAHFELWANELEGDSE